MNNSNIDLSFEKDADITEVLGMEDKLKEMETSLTENMTEHMVNVNKKVQELEFFLKNQYITRVYQIKQNTMAEVYKNGIEICRNKCFDHNLDDLENKEKNCYKNCFSKYSNSVDIYNKQKENLFNYFGFDIFSLNKNDTKALDKVYNFLGNKDI